MYIYRYKFRLTRDKTVIIDNIIEPVYLHVLLIHINYNNG